jgi:hypothetical protein
LKKQTKNLLLASFGVSVCLLALYAGVRTSQTSLLRKQLDALKAKEVRFGVTIADVDLLSRKFPVKADTAPFVEKLYELAKQSNIENVEITTPNVNMAAPSRKGPAVKDASKLLRPYQIRISCEGRYPAMAQYLGRIRDIERYNKAVSFELKPDKNRIKANIIIEIVSFEVQDAS